LPQIIAESQQQARENMKRDRGEDKAQN
jgi:hypothetical protein